MDPGNLIVAPNPVAEGANIHVDYQGDGTLYYSVDGGPWMKAPLDAAGMGEITAPVGSSLIAFSDQRGPNSEEDLVEVVSGNLRR